MSLKCLRRYTKGMAHSSLSLSLSVPLFQLRPLEASAATTFAPLAAAGKRDGSPPFGPCSGQIRDGLSDGQTHDGEDGLHNGEDTRRWIILVIRKQLVV